MGLMIKVIAWALRKLWADKADLVLENLALRQQVAVLRRREKRPVILPTDRTFWVGMSESLKGWKDAIAIVKPETVVGWHRTGFRLYWRWKSRGRPGRPEIPPKIQALIRRMAEMNPTWGAPRIHGELLKLGVELSEASVAKYVPRRRGPPSQTWRAFLKNHLGATAAMDLFVIPTVRFTLLWGLVIIGLQRRKILHVNVTTDPCAAWVGQQVTEAFPWDSALRFLIRDRDGIYGANCLRRIQHLGIEEVVTAPRSPWQNGYAERVIGSIRREMLDRVIVLGEDHARKMLHSYTSYFNKSRTHLSLGKDAPDGRAVHGPERGPVVIEIPVVGGLHHRYERLAA